MLARIRTDVSLANFEFRVRNLVSDVEVAYWELYYAYQRFGTAKEGRDDALAMWRKTYNLYTHGAKRGSAAAEASTRNQYYIYRTAAEQSLNELYATEAKLRYLLGLAATDGRLIRPKDEATTAKVTFDWCDVLSEGFGAKSGIARTQVGRQAVRVGVNRREELPSSETRPRGSVPLARYGQPAGWR